MDLRGSSTEGESEFFPPSVLLITGVLIVALIQLSGGPSSVMNRPTRAISPFSLTAFLRGIGATLQAIQMVSITTGGSLTAKMFAGAFPMSYLGFSWLPRILGNPKVTPSQIGVKMSDYFRPMNIIPSTSYLYRLVLHPFYVTSLETTSFSAVFYWIAFVPGCFYLTLALLDGAFVGGRHLSRSVSRATVLPVSVSVATQIISNFILVIIANAFCASTALHSSRTFSIFKLPVTNVFYGPEPLLFALFILLLYRNPVSSRQTLCL